MLTTMQIDEFIAALSSNLPAPGGGAAAALSGATGAALVAMVGNLTFGKKGYEEAEGKVRELVTEAEALWRSLLRYMNEDATAFSGVIDALKMPKDTEEEKAARTKAVQEGYKKAAEVPYRVAELSLSVLRLCPEMARVGNKNVLSDVGVAACSGWSALRSAVMNVTTNLTAIKDEEYTRRMGGQLTSWIEEGNRIYEEVAGYVEEQIRKK